MKKIFSLFILSALPALLRAQEASMGIDERINEIFGNYTGWFVSFIFYQLNIGGVKVFWVLIPLILGALYFTIYFSFPGIRLFKIAIQTVQGKFDDIDDGHHEVLDSQMPNVEGDIPDTIRVEGKEEGEVSHFQALTAALSATVGLGNIAGVAIAVAAGGPGATFWMIIAGLLGMSSKFVECTLGVKYREVEKDGTVHGGPMYYLSKGNIFNMPLFGKGLAIIFAIMCIGGSFGGGNMFQSNQAASIFLSKMDIVSSSGGFYFGIVMAILVGIVIIGGIKRIAQVTEKIVPFMALIYVGAALVIIILNIGLVPKAVGLIVSQAFMPKAIAGGFLGVLIQGFKRAAFSNEAGIGSASIAHSAVKTKYAASEGIVALLEPFIDTVVICTMTALVIVIFNMEGLFTYGAITDNNGVMIASQNLDLGGVGLTAMAFDSGIKGFSNILVIAVILFAFSTMISWSYYGLQSWKYLFGRGKVAEISYKVLFCLFIVIGASAQLGNVLDFSDAMIFAMMVPNMIGLIFLVPKVKEELDRYLTKIKKVK